MIQRIQTLYLLAAAALAGCMIMFPLAVFFGDGQELELLAFGIRNADFPDVTVADGMWLGVLLTASALLPLVTVFLFKRRLLQFRLCFSEIVLLVGSQIFILMYIFRGVSGLEDGSAVNSWRFMLPSVFPLVAIVLVALAIRGIARDERLVRSLDRIR